MKRFWKASLGSEVVFGTIDLKKFAKWIDDKRICTEYLPISDDDVIKLFPHLEYLRLYSDFSQFDLLENCVKLKHLDISYSEHLKDYHFKHIAKIPTLTSLNLYECRKINGEAFDQLYGLENLVDLNCSSTWITENGFEQIAGLINLNRLNLRGCRPPRLKPISRLANLTHLNLSFNISLRGEEVEHLKSLKNLVYLNLAATGLFDEGIKFLEPIQSLTTLDLSGCKYLTDECFKSVAKLVNLKQLILLTSRFTGEGVIPLAQLKNLKMINFGNTPTLTELGIISLRKINCAKNHNTFKNAAEEIIWPDYEP